MSKTTDGFSASSRSLNGLNSFNGDDGTFSSLRVDGDINVSNTSALNIDGYNPSAGQIIKKTATGMEWANEADNGIDLTEDNTGATNYEIILSNVATASNKTDFKTSALNFQPSLGICLQICLEEDLFPERGQHHSVEKLVFSFN